MTDPTEKVDVTNETIRQSLDIFNPGIEGSYSRSHQIATGAFAAEVFEVRDDPHF